MEVSAAADVTAVWVAEQACWAEVAIWEVAIWEVGTWEVATWEVAIWEVATEAASRV